MEININITGELDALMAAKQIRLIADMVKHGVMHVEGYNISYMGTFNLDVDLGEYPHGDYQDEEGNLLHIAGDHVINVTWASKDAEVEEVDVPVEDWISEHGQIHPAGHGHSHGDDDEGHEH